ncbi:hypothetical protein EUX98_g7376 [Antrodiella citrinella]|uniref:Uncharacterized protein n=1 Tax=Antrodiella citrinella TaxID=2447956 RepID=A0A4S4MLQ1_9APHY|nr:hypothetical protein EUX98_g7376 [Antrodiella citrinella]
MCQYRQVSNYYVLCGHSITEPDVEIKCNSPKCIFSPKHPATCTGPSCKEKCFQYHQFPQQFSPHVKAKCPNCA